MSENQSATTAAAVSNAEDPRATYASLFPEQLADKCQADALESAYGPLAYLHALYRQALDIEALSTDTSAIKLAKRRPDIGELLLDQGSLNNERPALTLAIESLSRQAQLHAGSKPLAEVLATATRHAGLPFHYPLTQISAVLRHKKLSHFDVLQQTEYYHPNFCHGALRTEEMRAVMRNACGLSPALQRLLLDDSATSGNDFFKSRFGIEGTQAKAVAALCDVEVFCRSTGLTPEEVMDLLAVSAVPDDGTEGFTAVRRSAAYRPGTDEAPSGHLFGAVFINAGATPALTLEDTRSGPGIQLKIKHATAAHFQRIYKMIHLRAALGLSFAQTDLLLTAAMRAHDPRKKTTLNEEVLRALGVFNFLRDRHGVSVEQYAALIWEVSPYSVGSDVPFLDRILDGPGAGQLASVNEGLIIDGREFDPHADADAQGHSPASSTIGRLSLALGVKEELTRLYLNLITKEQKLQKPCMSLSLVSSLYRLSRLPRLLGLSQLEGIALVALLSGQNAHVYSNMAGTPTISRDAETTDQLDVLVGLVNTHHWIGQNALSATMLLGLLTPPADAQAPATKQVVAASVRAIVAQALPRLHQTRVTEEALIAVAGPAPYESWLEILRDHVGFQGLINPRPRLEAKDTKAYLEDLFILGDEWADENKARATASMLAPVLSNARTAQENIARHIVTVALGKGVEGQKLSSEHALPLLRWAGTSAYNVLVDMLAAEAHDLTVAGGAAEPLSMLTPSLWFHLERHAAAARAIRISPAGLKALLDHPEWFDLQSSVERPGDDLSSSTALSLDLLYQLSRYRDWIELCGSNGFTESHALDYLRQRPRDGLPDAAKEASKQLSKLIGWQPNEVHLALPQVQVAIKPSTTAAVEGSLEAFLDSLTLYERYCYNAGADSPLGALGQLLSDYHQKVSDVAPAAGSINSKFAALMVKHEHKLKVQAADKIDIKAPDIWSTVIADKKTKKAVTLESYATGPRTFDDFVGTLTLDEYNYYVKEGIYRIVANYHWLAKGRRFETPITHSVYTKFAQFLIDNPGPLKVTETQKTAGYRKDIWTANTKSRRAEGLEPEHPTQLEFEVYATATTDQAEYESLPLVPASISDIDFILRQQALCNTTGLSCRSLTDLSCLDQDSTFHEAETSALLLLGACTDEARLALEQQLQPRWRDALVGYLMTHWVPSDSALKAFIPTAEALSAYFLSDVHVGAEVKTTAVSQAIASLQHYLHRLTAHLEPGHTSASVKPDTVEAWHQYLGQYGSWRARQEQQLHPENLIHYANRPHKSTAFEELEVEVNQGKLDSSLLQTAICNYLNKFERLSNLQVISGYLDGQDFLNDTYYLIGRTNGMPIEYYWRSLDMGLRDDKKRLSPLAWSEWKKIDLPATGVIEQRQFSQSSPNAKKEENLALKKARSAALKDKYFKLKDRQSKGWHYHFESEEVGIVLARSVPPGKEIISLEEYQLEREFLRSINVKDTVETQITLDMVRPIVVAGRPYVFWIERDTQGIPDAEDKTKITEDRAIRVLYCYLQSDGAWSPANEIIRLDGTYGAERGVPAANSLKSVKPLHPPAASKDTDTSKSAEAAKDTDTSKSTEATKSTDAPESENPEPPKGYTPGLIVVVNTEGERQADPWLMVMVHDVEWHQLGNRDKDYYLEAFDLLLEPKQLENNETTKNFAETLYKTYKDGSRIQTLYDGDEIVKVENTSTTYHSIAEAATSSNPGTEKTIELAYNEKLSLTAHNNSESLKLKLESSILTKKKPNKHILLKNGSFLDILYDDKNFENSTLETFNINIFPRYQRPDEGSLEDFTYASEKLMLGGIIKYKFSEIRDIERPLSIEVISNDGTHITLRERPKTSTHRIYYKKSDSTEDFVKFDKLSNDGNIVDFELTSAKSGEYLIRVETYVEEHKAREDLFKLKLGASGVDSIDSAQIWHKTQAQYLDLSGVTEVNSSIASPNIRLNTLFGKGLVSRATHSVERVLDWSTQQLPEPTIDINASTPPLDLHGANGLYFRELFLHLPALVAARLTEQQQFEDAERWYLNYLFDPYRNKAGDDAGLPKRERKEPFWNTRPLAEVGTLVSQLSKPVDPVSRAFVLSRYYRQAVFLSLLENWHLQGDHAYRQLTLSSLNQAWLCYQQALALLGPLPERAAVSRWQPARLMDISADSFLAPINRRVLELRDTLQRRIYNLRHGLTLDGKLLPDMGWADETADALKSANGALAITAIPYETGQSSIPAYRFRQLLPAARNAAQQLLDFGRHYMSLMEEEFNTSLSVLLKAQEIKISDFTLGIQKESVASVKVKKGTLEINKQAALYRRDYYAGLIDTGRNWLEESAAGLRLFEAAMLYGTLPLYGTAAALSSIPTIVGFSVGGQQPWKMPEKLTDFFASVSQITQIGADQMLRESEYERRAQDWAFEQKQAEWEIKALDNEIKNVDVELNAATLALNQARQDRSNLEEAYVAMTTGFTIIPVYNWLVARQELLYGAAYDAVLSLCLNVEAAWRYEIGDYKRAAFIRPSGWTNAYKGMLAGESLLNDLQEMENAYLLANERRLTIQKTFSLKKLLTGTKLNNWKDKLKDSTKPVPLDFEFTSADFDHNYPGHYLRQLKHVAVSLVMNTASEELEVSALLTQTGSITLVEANAEGANYCYPDKSSSSPPAIPRSIKRNQRANQQIALSSTVSQDGMGSGLGGQVYKLLFDDNRYLPFEGTGAISQWRLEIPDQLFAKKLSTALEDIRIDLIYTACDGGHDFREIIKKKRPNRPTETASGSTTQKDNVQGGIPDGHIS